MRKGTAATILVLAAMALCASGKSGHCTFRVHTEANENDGPVFSSRYQSRLTGKPVVLGKLPALSEQDVVSFQVYKASDGTYGALLQLNEHGRITLDSLSIERRGTMLFVFINGRPLTELQIDRRVSDGKFYIASGLTPADLALMEKDWRLIGPRKK